MLSENSLISQRQWLKAWYLFHKNQNGKSKKEVGEDQRKTELTTAGMSQFMDQGSNRAYLLGDKV